jgi:hypothetical protein
MYCVRNSNSIFRSKYFFFEKKTLFCELVTGIGYNRADDRIHAFVE